eukprot:2901767-Rhodomonas_salina.3
MTELLTHLKYKEDHDVRDGQPNDPYRIDVESQVPRPVAKIKYVARTENNLPDSSVPLLCGYFVVLVIAGPVPFPALE